MKCKAATPAGTARAEDPGLSAAREAAEAVPAESVRLERKATVYANKVVYCLLLLMISSFPFAMQPLRDSAILIQLKANESRVSP
ncbi:hypothetical protein QTL97_05245 [Sporosarcina thermotolerans]|uniref:Uncharacterized protein n=1 Tax=Sporosarcina thermotolerans TaxID=633404 RepID=A0AAW9A603_9BACL|nr:hypothetical protein [Sporosarcina thermotolerans]MDW0116330.1 hypothetical protein [Sporosarcina thermotolerans]